MRARASLGPGLVRVRPANAASRRGDLLDRRLPPETLPLLPLQMTEETIGYPSTPSGHLSGPRHGHTRRARSDVVATAALTHRQRPSRSGMLFRRIRPEPTVAADRQPGRRPEDDRQLSPGPPAGHQASASRRPTRPALSRGRPTALQPCIWAPKERATRVAARLAGFPAAVPSSSSHASQRLVIQILSAHRVPMSALSEHMNWVPPPSGRSTVLGGPAVGMSRAFTSPPARMSTAGGCPSRLAPRAAVPARDGVELGDHLAIGGARGVQFLPAFLQLPGELNDVLLKFGDPPFELVNVLRCAEPGLPPSLVAEHLGELGLQLADPGGLAGDLALGVPKHRLVPCAQADAAPALRPRPSPAGQPAPSATACEPANKTSDDGPRPPSERTNPSSARHLPSHCIAHRPRIRRLGAR